MRFNRVSLTLTMDCMTTHLLLLSLDIGTACSTLFCQAGNTINRFFRDVYRAGFTSPTLIPWCFLAGVLNFERIIHFIYHLVLCHYSDRCMEGHSGRSRLAVPAHARLGRVRDRGDPIRCERGMVLCSKSPFTTFRRRPNNSMHCNFGVEYNTLCRRSGKLNWGSWSRTT